MNLSSTKQGVRLLSILCLLSILPSSLAYTETTLTDGYPRCWGQYGPNSVPGKSRSGTITPDLSAIPTSEKLAVLIFDYQGDAFDANEPGQICGDVEVADNLCAIVDKGKWIISSGATSPYLNVLVDMSNTTRPKLSFDVAMTGYWCILATPTVHIGTEYALPVLVTNPYGLLPATDYPKLLFYGVLTIVYLIVGLAWMALSFRHWADLLPVQLYLLAASVFLTLEMAFNYGFFEDYNAWGRSSTGLLVVCVLLNAGRNSAAFFMLLIVSLGYGVVRPTLGSTMNKCRYLTVLHFFCGVVYAASSLIVTEISIWVLLSCVLPLSTTMTAFYFWILQGITRSMAHLESRRQPVKLRMYRRLWDLLVASVVVIVVMFAVDSLFFANRESPAWAPTHWKVRWFLLDGWLNTLFLAIFIGISVLWRPTEQNQRYGLDELAQDDNEDDFRTRSGETTAGQQIGLRRLTARDEEDGLGDDNDFEGLDDLEDDDVLNWAEENVGSQKPAPHTPIIDDKIN